MGKGFGQLALGALLQLSQVRAVVGRGKPSRGGGSLSPQVVEMVVASLLVVGSERASGMGITVAAVLVSLAMARARGAGK